MRQPIKVAIYARVSTSNPTTANQAAELERVSGRRGWTIVETCADEGIDSVRTAIVALRAKEVSIRKIAAQLKVGTGTIYSVFAAAASP